jgi:hypothetical protein
MYQNLVLNRPQQHTLFPNTAAAAAGAAACSIIRSCRAEASLRLKVQNT